MVDIFLIFWIIITFYLLYHLQKKNKIIAELKKALETGEIPEKLLQSEKAEKPIRIRGVKIKLLNRPGKKRGDKFSTYIAGTAHHVKPSEIGAYVGYVANERTNKYDPEAMGIYFENKLVGYIPDSELDDYWDWCEGNPMPCVGFIYIEENKLRGKVSVIRPCNEEFISQEINSYLQWVVDNYGAQFAPKNLEFNFELEDDDESIPAPES